MFSTIESVLVNWNKGGQFIIFQTTNQIQLLKKKMFMFFSFSFFSQQKIILYLSKVLKKHEQMFG